MRPLGRSTRDERRRLLELFAMFLIASMLLGLSRLEQNLFELSERLSQHSDFITSVVYFGLINVNVVLILVLSFLIFRNIVKLVVDRRHGVIGSRLRTKLVVSLVFFALAPTALLFYVSSRFLTESFDTWFSKKVEATILRTKEAGALVYKRDKRRLESLSRIALQRIDVTPRRHGRLDSLTTINGARLEGFTTEYRLDAVRVFDRSAALVWQNRAAPVSSAGGDVFVFNTLDRFAANPGLMSKGSVDVEGGRDVVKGMAPIYEPHTGILLGLVMTEERFETQIIQGVEAILAEFSNLRPGAQLIRMSYVILLVMMVLIIVFSATWLGFYVAKMIIAPIQSLAEATREVALGNYEVALVVKTDDETGQLVKSFNRMTLDLKHHEAHAKSVTDQLKFTNEELERRRKYTEVILQNVTAGVIAVNAAAVVTSVNHAAENLLAIDAQACLGREVRLALGSELWESFWRPLTERATAQPYHGEIECERAGKLLTLIADATPIQDESGQDLGWVVVFDDAAEQVRAQKVAAWREVARRIAHEIKNPITPIKLSAQRLLRRFGNQFSGQDREVFASCVNTIISEVDSLRNLVNEFSRFARLPTVRLEPGAINAIILDVKSLYELSYPRVRLDVSGLSPDLPLVPLDREQFSRALVNLVTNALAAIDEQGGIGQISFRTTLLPTLHSIRLEVADTGPGIPIAIRDRVLEPYFSTKAEGSGLGLAIVNQVVTDHGGYLRIFDNVPSGTVVVIEIPLGVSNLGTMGVIS